MSNKSNFDFRENSLSLIINDVLDCHRTMSTIYEQQSIADRCLKIKTLLKKLFFILWRGKVGNFYIEVTLFLTHRGKDSI